MFLRFNLFTILWFFLILVLVMLPGRELPKLGEPLFSVDKVVHTVLFAVFALLMVVGFVKQSAYPYLRNNAIRSTLVFSITYATLIEITQFLADGRTFDFYDAVANVSGCVVGYLLFVVIYKQ